MNATWVAPALLALLAVRGTAQSTDQLTAHAAELRDPSTGTITVLDNTARALIGLFQSRPDEAVEVDWETCAFDLVEAYEVRGEGHFFRTYVPWRVAVELRAAGAVERAEQLVRTALAGLPEGEERGFESPHTAFLHLELADFARHFGDWGVARSELDRARGWLVPPDSDPFEFTPPADDVPRTAALGTWFDITGQLYFDLGRGGVAARYFDELLERASDLEDSALFWSALDNLARLALAEERFDDVDRLWELVLDLPDWVVETPVDRPRVALSRLSADLTRAHRDDDASGQHLGELFALRDDDQVATHDAVFADLLIAVSALDAEFLEEATRALEDADRRRSNWGVETPRSTQAAFALVALRGRAARLAGDADEVAAAAQAARDAFEPFVDSWSRTPVWPGGIGFLLADWRQAYLLESLLLVLEQGREDATEEAASMLLRVQHRGTLTRAMEVAAVTLDEVRQTLLAGGRGAVTFVPGREESLAVAIDGKRVRFVRLAADHHLRAARRALEEASLESIASPTDEGARDRLARAVGRATDAFLPRELWGILEGWSEIIVVGGDDAGLFGFEALEPVAGRPIGFDCPVSHIPSLPVGVHLARSRRGPTETESSGSVLLAPTSTAAAPDPRTELPPIPFADPLANDLEQLYENSVVLGGADATRTRLAETRLRSARAMTVVAHGLYDPLRERPVGLLLEDGPLWAADVVEIESPELVDLVACGTGRGPRRQGDDGGTHLGGAFLQAGAHVVVVGQTDFEYSASLALHGAFQRQLARGLSAAEALQRARVEARTTDEGRLVPPVHDLLVRVYGLGSVSFEPTPATARSARRGWFVAAGVVGLVLGLAALRRS